MGAHVTCDHCTTVVDKVLCENHAELKCDACAKVADRLLCEACAEDEFGEDDVSRDPDEEDLADYIEHSVMTDHVADLAVAIRRGDRGEAEYLLDKIAAAVPGWADRVSISRYSPRAKAA